jgi:hypothetical protein
MSKQKRRAHVGGKVCSVGETSFQMENLEVTWPLREEDRHRVEVGDAVTVETVVDFPWGGDPSGLDESDRVKTRIVRISKGGNAAFQG